ncbi:MAG TPA: N-acetylmuramic acid 6-phosphate etherase, partial [Planctomycetota bacterium]|nr:N-acetylmuramic acid 6-phosphate etherase [Planctomycetota bacterium]
AGTSGRLGVLDAAECPPTFGLDPGRVVAIIAGGDRAFVRAVEGAEDSTDDGARAIEDARACDRDIVCGIAASGTTPFVRAALRKAKSLGATSALLHSNSRLAREDLEEVDHPILLDVGPEVVAGSTRMKCGTATKLAVQMLTTAAMIRAGKVYDNLMVDVVPTNRKLERRACLLVSRLARVDEGRALELLAAADWRVKVAVVLELAKTDAREAKRLLDENDGHLRRALRAAGVAEDALPGSRAVD